MPRPDIALVSALKKPRRRADGVGLTSMSEPSSASLRAGPLARRQPRGHWGRSLGVVLLLALGLGTVRLAALDPSRSLAQYNTRTWRRVNQLPSNLVST